jgi:hypothetical protein
VFNLTYNKEGRPYEIQQQEHKAVVYDFEPQQDVMRVAETVAPYGSNADEE